MQYEIRFKKLDAQNWIGYIGFVSYKFNPIYAEIGLINDIYEKLWTVVKKKNISCI